MTAVDEILNDARRVVASGIPPLSCPACGLVCELHIPTDLATCPKHGEIMGMTMARCRGMEPWEALIEIRAAQAYADIYREWSWPNG